MKKILLFVILLAIVSTAKINILTTVIINELPYEQKLTCSDCVQPVTYTA